MHIKPILCAFAFAIAPLAFAQQAPGRGAGIDPASLTQEQIAQTQVPSALFRLAALYKQNGDMQRLEWTLQRLVVLQPNTTDLKLALATAYAMEGKKTETYDTLLAMQRAGYGYDLAGNPNFAKVADTRVWTYIVDGLKANLKPFGEGKVAFTLPGGDHLYESLAWDPARKQFLVGSVRDGTIQRADRDGRLTDFIKPDAQNGLWSVYALAAVPSDDALYVASTASVYFKGFAQADYGKAGVFRFKLSTGKLEDKYLLGPSAGQVQTLSSITAGKGGLVFAADGLRNIIYKLDGHELKPMVGNPRLTSVRGLALSGDDKTLYFADYALGVFGVDLAAGKGFDLQYAVTSLALGGIDGLYWYDHMLIAIQNGMTPHRVMRLALSDDGRSITRAMPLDAARPELTLPTYGTIADDGLYFVANSQKNAYGAYGTPKDDAKLQPVQVFRSDLRFAWDQPGIPTALPNRPAGPPVLSRSTPGSGVFGNVEGGSESVTGN
jgi:sugar lactone lactonase YvrE